MGRARQQRRSVTAAASRRGGALADALGCFEALRPGGGSWSCDGGAAVLEHILSGRGIPNQLRVGLYDPDGPDEEHHHWVETEDGQLIDPNGELRGEPRVQPLAGARQRYRPRDNGWESRSDREIMEYSPLYDWDNEGNLLSLEELHDHYDPAVVTYQRTLGLKGASPTRRS